MDNKEFKKMLSLCLEKKGFKYNKKRYYKYTDNLIIVVDTQKSNFDNSYYVNYAFFVKEIYNGDDYPKTKDGDIRGRFGFDYEGETYDYYLLNVENKNTIKNSFEYNINNVLLPVTKFGINKYFELFPKAICTSTNKLQHYLRDNNLLNKQQRM